VTDNLGIRIVNAEAHKELAHGGFLGFGAGVGRTAAAVEPSLIADAYAVGVVAAGMGTGLALGTAWIENAVAGDVVVIAHGMEATRLVTCFEVLEGETAVGTGCRAVNDDKIYATHF